MKRFQDASRRFGAAAAPTLMLTLALVLGCASNTGHPSRGTFAVTILHVNDSHSRLDSEETTLQLLNSAGQRETVQVDFGGFPRVVAALRQMEEAAQPTPVLKLHAGDAVTGDMYFDLFHGEPEAALMNLTCFDAFTLGNHEFDNGDAGLRRFIDHLHRGRCQTPVLSANVRFTGPTVERNLPWLVKGSTVLLRGGQHIGIVGVTIAEKTLHASRPTAGTAFDEEVGAVQSEIDRLQALGVNKVVLQSHLGYGMDQAIAPRLSGVDVIVGGDSHTLLGPAHLKDYGFSAAGNYPSILADKTGQPVCIVQAWQYAYVVGELNVVFDAQGHVTQCTGTPHLLIGEHLRRRHVPINGADRAAMLADIARSHFLRITSPDPTAVALLEPYARTKAEFAASVVGQADKPLCLRRVPGRLDTTRSSLGDTCNQDVSVNARGGDVQQIVANAFLQSARAFFPADLSLQSGGGVRSDIPVGPVTVGQIHAVLPFRNTLVKLEATGAEVKAALEDALDAVVVRGNSGGYPYAGGLRFDVDLNRAKGERITNLRLNQGDGRFARFDLGTTYQVATTDFLADGGDFYGALQGVNGHRRTNVGLEYSNALKLHIESLPGRTLRRPAPENYSTDVFVDLK